MIIEYQKVTVGFVVQSFEMIDGKFVCTSQDFIAGDDVNYEDDFGDKLSPEKLAIVQKDEAYQPFDMKQSNTEKEIITISMQGGLIQSVEILERSNVEIVVKDYDAENFEEEDLKKDNDGFYHESRYKNE